MDIKAIVYQSARPQGARVVYKWRYQNYEQPLSPVSYEQLPYRQGAAVILHWPLNIVRNKNVD